MGPNRKVMPSMLYLLCVCIQQYTVVIHTLYPQNIQNQSHSSYTALHIAFSRLLYIHFIHSFALSFCAVFFSSLPLSIHSSLFSYISFECRLSVSIHWKWFRIRFYHNFSIENQLGFPIQANICMTSIHIHTTHIQTLNIQSSHRKA